MKNALLLAASVAMVLFACKKEEDPQAATPTTPTYNHDARLIGKWYQDSTYTEGNKKATYVDTSDAIKYNSQFQIYIQKFDEP